MTLYMLFSSWRFLHFISKKCLQNTQQPHYCPAHQLIMQLILQKCLLFANELNLAIFSLGQIYSRQLLKIKNLPAFVCMKCTLQWNVLVSKTQPFCSVKLQVQLRTAVSFASWWVSTKPGDQLRPSAVLSPWHINSSYFHYSQKPLMEKKRVRGFRIEQKEQSSLSPPNPNHLIILTGLSDQVDFLF